MTWQVWHLLFLSAVIKDHSSKNVVVSTIPKVVAKYSNEFEARVHGSSDKPIIQVSCHECGNAGPFCKWGTALLFYIKKHFFLYFFTIKIYDISWIYTRQKIIICISLVHYCCSNLKLQQNDQHTFPIVNSEQENTKKNEYLLRYFWNSSLWISFLAWLKDSNFDVLCGRLHYFSI